MTRVGSRKLKNRLGAYLARVKRGETILITDRGEPVAQLGPCQTSRASGPTVDDILRQMEAEGHLRLATRPFPKRKPIPCKGKPASQMIIEDRE